LNVHILVIYFVYEGVDLDGTEAVVGVKKGLHTGNEYEV